MPPDYRLAEQELAVCRACESLVPAAEMMLADQGALCYGCAMVARGCVAMDLEIEVGA